MIRAILSLDSKRKYLLFGNRGKFCFEEITHFSRTLRVSCSYALPLTVALVAFILRWIADMTCSPYSQVCRKSSDLLSHIYAVVVIFLVIVAATKAKQIKDLVNKVKAAFEMMNSDGNKQKKD